jgi:hypothetical protein
MLDDVSRILLASVVIGCGPGASHPSAPEMPPAATTDCYAGMSTGMGQSSHTIARRTVDPVAKTITEDVTHDNAGPHGAKSFHVVMTVDGAHFTMNETGGAFTGTGSLVGQPWQWTSWTSVSQIANTSITVESHDELTSYGMKADKQIKQDGKLIATSADELRAFECAQWDDAKTAMLAPVVDRPRCERACRQFATLKFWQHADDEIAALPPADQAAARAAKTDDFATKLAAGLETCVTSCLSANNPEQTACWGDATTVEQLARCDQS